MTKFETVPHPSSALASTTRRCALAVGSLFLGGCTSASRQGPPARDVTSASDDAASPKFGVLRGVQLQVDSLFQVVGLNIFDEQGRLFFSAARMTPPRGRARTNYGADFGVPKHLRVEWRDRYATAADPPQPPPPNHVPGAFYGGTVLGNYTVPVASRIPDAFLDEMRRNGGGFRLKIRIHPDGPLIGWDFERGLPLAADGSRYHFAGGDFQEAFIYNGKPLRKGWFIHPRTGQRVETDF